MFELSLPIDKIKIVVFGNVRTVIDKNLMSEQMSNVYLILDKPVESISWNTFSKNKCFTYFSPIRKYWKTFRIDLNKIYVLIDHHKYWYPPSLDNNIYYMSVHSPNHLPQFSIESDLFVTNSKSFLKYSQINSQLLGEGYETNCYNYDLDNEQATIRMKSDCFTRSNLVRSTIELVSYHQDIS